MKPPSPIACRLDALGPVERARRAEVLATLEAKATSSGPTEDGVVFTWAGDGDLLLLVAVSRWSRRAGR